MKCHYEVLNISREASDGEIKSAYRKLALKWHPDKNLDNVEYAKEQFQLVQQAYEILSDGQERAWYDKHREQILRGSNSDYKDNNLDVFQYFTRTCFQGYGNDEKGFYFIYNRVFEEIAKEDFEYIDNEEEMHAIPKFGNSNSDYDEVKGFYDYWMSYSTKKSYVWLDPHDIKEATNRKIYKLIEKENVKIRQKAKQERNEEVRNLVAFVRKRDKRVQAHIQYLESKKIENREKQKKLTNQMRLNRIKQLNESSEEAEWMKFDNVKSQLEEIEKKLAEQYGDEASDSDENVNLEIMSNLYCVACNKIFKTPKAFKNHESSKKHKGNLENLKHIMLADDLTSAKSVGNNTENDQLYDSSSSSENTDQNDTDFMNIKENKSNILESKSKKKNKKAKCVVKIEVHDSDAEISNEMFVTRGGSDDELKSNKKPKRKKKKDQQTKKEDKELNTSETVSTKVKNTAAENRKAYEPEINLNKDRCCANCKTQFPSKNKLFEHLKKTGHSCYLNSTIIDKKKLKQK